MDLSEVKHLPRVDHTPAELDEPAKLLLKAADLIEKYGLAKWMTCDAEGRMCLRGAIRVAGGAEKARGITAWWRSDDMEKEADARIRRSLGDRSDFGDTSADWNNAYERTKDEVVAKLRAVALGG